MTDANASANSSSQVDQVSIAAPLLLGVQPVAAWWFAAAWSTPQRNLQSLLQRWELGAKAYRFAQGDLLVLPQARTLDTALHRGWPLIRLNDTLYSAQLSPQQRQQLPAADAWIVVGNRPMPLNFGAEHLLDLSGILDLSAYAWIEPGALQQPRLTQVLDDEQPPKAIHDVLGPAVPAPSAALLDFMKTLHAAKPGQAPDLGRPPGVGRAPGGWGWGRTSLLLLGLLGVVFWGGKMGLAAWRMALMVALLALVMGVTRRANQPPVIGHPGAAPVAAPPPSLPARRPWARLPSLWKRLTDSLANMTGLSSLLSTQHAQYMRRMIRMFESGDLTEALRHAVPLNESTLSAGQHLGLLGPRHKLNMAQAGGASKAVYLGADFNQYLRNLYRRSFEKLDAAGRTEEAAYVLAQLLDAKLEALDYLERKGHATQAAELALGWDMPAATIVRLLALSGDWRRAVAVARRDQAFEAAVAQLQAKWPDVALRLRLEWGQTLAHSGYWLLAVECLWPVPEHKAQALAWLQQAEQAGGELATRALVLRSLWQPDAVAHYPAQVQRLRADPNARGERLALAREVLRHKRLPPGTVQLLRHTLGPILVDHADGSGELAASDLQALADRCGDDMLVADWPKQALPGPTRRPLDALSEPLSITMDACAGPPITDAVNLTEGRYLLALGELGAAVVDAHGQVLTRYPVPAQHIVLAHSQQLALLVMRRSQQLRVSRLDLLNRRVTDLGSIAVDAFATEFDGVTWTVGQGNAIRVLDCTQSLTDVLWQVADLPGQVLALCAAPDCEQALLHQMQGSATGAPTQGYWRYALPLRRLQCREEFPYDPGQFRSLNPANSALHVFQFVNTKGPSEAASPPNLARLRSNNPRIDSLQLLGLGAAEGLALQTRSVWALLNPGLASRTRYVFNLQTLDVKVVVHIQTATAQRLTDSGVLFFSSLGQVVHVNTATAAVVKFHIS